MDSYHIEPIGMIRSELRRVEDAPRQGDEGAPEAWVDIDEKVAAGLSSIAIEDELILLTWFHLADREVLQVHPRGDTSRPITGVFATRSPDRPNPIGLHRVTVLEVAGPRIRVAPLEAIDGTPVIDIKPVLGDFEDR